MKVFVTMSDAVLGDNVELNQKLVPFKPEFLGRTQEAKEGSKPGNWVSDCDYQRARQRLYSSHV